MIWTTKDWRRGLNKLRQKIKGPKKGFKQPKWNQIEKWFKEQWVKEGLKDNQYKSKQKVNWTAKGLLSNYNKPTQNIKWTSMSWRRVKKQPKQIETKNSEMNVKGLTQAGPVRIY